MCQTPRAAAGAAGRIDPEAVRSESPPAATPIPNRETRMLSSLEQHHAVAETPRDHRQKRAAEPEPMTTRSVSEWTEVTTGDNASAPGRRVWKFETGNQRNEPWIGPHRIVMGATFIQRTVPADARPLSSGIGNLFRVTERRVHVRDINGSISELSPAEDLQRVVTPPHRRIDAGQGHSLAVRDD